MKDKDYLFPLSPGSWGNRVKPRVWSQAATFGVRAGLGLWPLRPHPWFFLFFPSTFVSDTVQTPLSGGWVKATGFVSCGNQVRSSFNEFIWDMCFLALICTCLFPNQPHAETQSWQVAMMTYQGSSPPPSPLPVPPDVFLLKWQAYQGYSVFCQQIDKGWTRNIREGNGTLLQYSCLENPTDGGAW